MSKSTNDRFGNGWRWDSEENALIVFFEVDDLSVDADGNTGPGGIAVTSRFNEGVVPDDAECESMAQEVLNTDFPVLEGREKRIISWDYYLGEYMDEEEATDEQD